MKKEHSVKEPGDAVTMQLRFCDLYFAYIILEKN